MTDPAEAVRAACDAAIPSSRCFWPSCNCLVGIERKDILAALISAAEKRGAEAERESAAKVVDQWAEQNRAEAAKQRVKASRLGLDVFGHGDMAYAAADELTSCARECEAIAAAIRSRGTEAG